MDKQIITFSANEQNLVRIGGEYHYSSNKVSYIGAHFDLGTNWNGFDSVRAVWFTDRINGISTVLDGEGNCIVPTEVLKKKDRVFVNLVGSIVSNGELTDRLTTYPAVALVVDSKAKVDSTETAPVTPSQFEQFVSIVQDAVANIKDIVSTTLNADYTLTFVYSDGTSYTTPSIRGERGPQGADGADGTDGNGIASAVLNSNYTLTLTFTDGTSYTTPSIRGAQGPKGDPGDVSQAQLDAVVSDLKSDIDVLLPDAIAKALFVNRGAISYSNGNADISFANRLHTTLSCGHIGDIISIPSGYDYWIAYYDVTNGYYDNSYDADGWSTGEYALKHNGLFALNIKKTDGTNFTENECYSLNGNIIRYSSNKVKVDDVRFDVGSLQTTDNSALWALTGNDYEFFAWDNITKPYHTTRWVSEKVTFQKGATIEVANGYRFYVMTFVNNTATAVGWETGIYTFAEKIDARIVLDVVSDTKVPYTQWEDLSDVVNIVNNKSQIEVDNRIEKIENAIGYKELYIGELINGHLVASGVVNDTYTNYRLSSKEIVAFPCGSNKKLKVHVNGDYLFAIRCGASSTDLDSNLFWYADGDEITIPDGANYYAVSICNIAGDSSHTSKTIAPTENLGLSILYENSFDILDANDEPSRILSNARLFFDTDVLNTIKKYAIIGHTSDCHGDYERVNNFLKYCDNCKVDVACITGDIVSYQPSQGIDWFNEILLNHDSLPAICTGNHDVYDNTLTDSDIYDFMFADVAAKIKNTTGKTWYYTDIASKKLRVISVNLYQYGGDSRWYTHFTDEQLAWIVTTLKSTPNNYGVIILSHASQVDLDSAKDANYPAFFQDARLYNNTHNAVSGGVPLYDIVDAFISRTTLSKTYTQTGSPSSVVVSADFSSVDSSVEFIAHLTGHFHQDSICFVPNRTNKQLMLNVTCTNAIYGGSTYPYLADIQDQARYNMDATQDAFNMYVVDRDNKIVKVVRVGNNLTHQMRERKYMEIPYAD